MASYVQVRGGEADPSTWRYTLQIESPDGGPRTGTYGAARVLHWRLAPSPLFPWRGRSPLEHGPASLALAGALERSLTGEAAVPVARVLAVTYEGRLKADRKAEAQDTMPLVRTVGDGSVVAQIFDHAMTPSARGLLRMGADPTPASVDLRAQLREDVCACYGTPAALLYPASGAAQALRELRAVWARATVRPLVDSLTLELRRVLEDPDLAFRLPLLEIETQEAEARRLARRAGAVANLLRAGLSLADAERVADGGAA